MGGFAYMYTSIANAFFPPRSSHNEPYVLPNLTLVCGLFFFKVSLNKSGTIAILGNIYNWK